jgi:hypothetical protein
VQSKLRKRDVCCVTLLIVWLIGLQPSEFRLLYPAELVDLSPALTEDQLDFIHVSIRCFFPLWSRI